jgi:hypothetical protein
VISKCCSCISGFVCARPDTDAKVEYYEDTYNDEPWECTFGTSDQDGIWVNYSDKVGQIMSSTVWVLISYSVLTISLLAHNQNLPKSVAMVYATICTLALSSHVKTMFTDPGSIPREAVPRAVLFKKGITTHAMCSHCQTYKPPQSHHCRICNRCISRMDHHCPWMNNCVGANNFSKYPCIDWGQDQRHIMNSHTTIICSFSQQWHLFFILETHTKWQHTHTHTHTEHFILFLSYTWIGCAYALILFAINYFFCSSEQCIFDIILVQLVRVMTILCIVTLLFVSSM